MLLPVVAIVGRPNVGKSTLFNRLTQSRAALISDYPGTTRDRQYGEADLDQRRFIVIDTGGIAEKVDELGNLTTEQSLQAIEDADKILFIVDGKADITPEDMAIAQLLRRSGKSVTLVVNKTEGLDPTLSVADYYKLGMGTPYPIAAAHGTGISALIEAIFPETTAHPDDEESEPSDHSVKFAFVGRPNVGKSTLTNRMLGEDRVIVHDTPGTTRDSIFIPLERFDKKYTVIDTAGVRRRKNISLVAEKFSIVKTLQAIESAHVIVYLIDARLGVSEQDLKLLGFVLECGKALVIAINKWDGLSEEAKENARMTIDRHLDFVPFARIHFISALHGTGVGNLFTSIDEAYEAATRKLSTPELSRLLEKAIVTHTPPLVKGRRIKLRYAHAGGHNPPTIIIHGNQLPALPDSYKRYLSRFFQERLELHGTPVRIIFKTNDNPYVRKRKKEK
jgi:GTP-binding protein